MKYPTDFTGVPQIPDDVAAVLKRGYEPTDEQERRAELYIAVACEAILALKPREFGEPPVDALAIPDWQLMPIGNRGGRRG